MDTVDFTIQNLGVASIRTPIILSNKVKDYVAGYVSDNDMIINDVTRVPGTNQVYTKKNLLEKAGPRDMIYFDPVKVHAAIVTCGGLCPGLNNVIRSVVMSLWHVYGVRVISGIRNGYRGFLPESNLPVIELNPDVVSDIHKDGGSILGSSRGMGERVTEIVDSLERMNVSILFSIGGDGTQKGSLSISEEISKRGLKISVIGIPKTIDNDLCFIQRSFGFETAVSKAVEAVSCAHTEARCAINGISIVKLMGRESGFIAAHTSIASNDVNFTLIPELPFDLDGPNGLLVHLKNRVLRRKHAVIVVAEGAGQEHLSNDNAGKDASGNTLLGDIGLYLKDRVSKYFKSEKIDANIRYIDPSYIIRSTAADPGDSIYCTRLGTNAVHAAMAGKTNMLVSLINNTFVHVPIQLAVEKRNTIDPEGELWRDVIQATGQPPLMKNV
ncbi:MAG: ATP-dependent 6-phosphofructokinase [Fibrobacter sp.]|nr:ATP-dependent 6-phosphofructokinase [Fibrobacter sp.]